MHNMLVYTRGRGGGVDERGAVPIILGRQLVRQHHLADHFKKQVQKSGHIWLVFARGTHAPTQAKRRGGVGPEPTGRGASRWEGSPHPICRQL